MKQLQKWKKNKFVRNVLVLFSGTALAQVITIAAVPILTRLYSPDAFGTLSIYTSIVAILTIFMTMKYEYAIVTARNEREAISVVYLTLWILIAATALLYILIYVAGDMFLSVFQIDELGTILWLVPLSLVFFGAIAILKYWMNRHESYKVLSYTNVANNGSRAAVQIGLGLQTASTMGLVAGQMFGNFLNAALLWWKAVRTTGLNTVHRPSIHEIRTAAVTFSQYPKFNAPNTLVNNLANNSPPFVLAYFFGPAIVGLYYLSVRLIKTPVNIFAQSLGQVFLKKATTIHQDGRSLYPAYRKMTAVLFAAGIAPVLALIVISPPLFTFVLGVEWTGAGEIARWVIIWHFFIYLREPALKVILIKGWQKFLLIVNAVFVTAGLVSLVLGGLFLGALETVIVYSLIGAVSNIVVIAATFLLLHTEHRSKKEDAPYDQHS
ncbi:hypothetical protein CR205_13565 [Alteribacter lacisalsi]|uniref:Lipopolysaccharide biosynthesis protein n=1 Tax=Alteribacter lacisalsi TaxID=2045244 RepID=A0A2W0H6G9_9BACI|nr:oligosaccharide flippase family protein [Alteribacter lacisalsi]PYZ96717.1 hypothetical protein CR205_13565 [Alteribacter lacisalsi]